MSSGIPKSKLEAQQAKLEAQWNKFWARLQRMPKWKDHFSRAPLNADVLVMPARLCWDLAIEDRDRLQGRLDELNLATLNQVSVLKQMLSEKTKGEIQDAEHGAEELCRHHEPVRYLSADVRKLVVQVIAEKLRQINAGQLPSGLSDLGGGATEDDELLKAMRLAEKRAEEAEEKATQMEEKMRNVEFKVEVLEKEAEKRQLELQRAHEREEALMQEVAAKTQQVEELQLANSQQQRQIQGLEEEIAYLKKQIEILCDKLKELDFLKEQLSVCRGKLAETETILREAESASASLQEEKQQMERRVSKLEKAALASERKLRERNEEIAGLKQQVKEMHTAMQQMAEGGPAPMKLPQMPVLLQPGSSSKAGGRCWDRLYEDATARAIRLKQLQDHYAGQKQQDVECALKLAEEAMQDYNTLLERIVQEEEMRWWQRNCSNRDIPSRDAAMQASFREHSLQGWTWEKERGWVCMTLPSEAVQSALPEKLLDATNTQWIPEIVGTAPKPKAVRRLLPFTPPASNFTRGPQLGSARESRRIEDVQLPSLTSRRHEPVSGLRSY